MTDGRANSVIPSPREITTEPRFSDKVFRGIVTTGGLSSLLILGLIAIFLGYQGFEILAKEGWTFLTTSEWNVEVDSNGKILNSSFGLAAMLIGTMLCAIIAVIIAVPISVASAIFLSFYAPGSLKKFLVSVIDLMAAFPSILYGFWGLFVLMPSAEYWAKIINNRPGGTNIEFAVIHSDAQSSRSMRLPNWT